MHGRYDEILTWKREAEPLYKLLREPKRLVCSHPKRGVGWQRPSERIPNSWGRLQLLLLANVAMRLRQMRPPKNQVNP
jgi:hypothetical protein